MAVFTEYSANVPTLVRSILLESMAAFADKPAVLAKKDEGYRSYTYRRLRSDVEALGTEFAARGLLDKKIIILGRGCYEWVLSVLASLFGTSVAVPVNKNISEAELCRIAKHTEAAAVVYADALQSKVDALPQEVIKLPFSSFDTLLEQGRKKIRNGMGGFCSIPLKRNTPALVLFAAGNDTAELPRGVELSNANLCFVIKRVPSVLGVDSNDTFLSVLPLHHIYALMMNLLVPLSVGATVAFGEGLHTVMKNINEVRPTVLVTTPVIAEALWRKVQKLSQSHVKRTKASIVASNLLPQKLGTPLKKKVFSDIHNAFGGSLGLIVTGGAPIGEPVMRGLADVGFRALECYSLCEGSAIVTLNSPNAPRYGSVGLALPDSLVDIYNVGEDGTGEIRIQSDAVMLGYFRDQEKTNQVKRGNWLYTGDLGRMDKDGYLYITGRKANVMVSATGKNIFPEELESLLQQQPFVREAVVVGFINEKKRDYDLVAVVFPDHEKLTECYGENYTVADIDAEVGNAVNKVNASLPQYKHIDYFVLRKNEFEKTGARKIRRTGISASIEQEYRKIKNDD